MTSPEAEAIARVEELYRLEALAKAATGGGKHAWKAEGHIIFGDWHASGGIAAIRSGGKAYADTAFIAAANPETILKLIDLAKQVGGLREALEGIAKRTAPHPDDTIADTAKDALKAHAMASAALQREPITRERE